MAVNIDAKSVALVAASSAAITYLIAKRHFESKAKATSSAERKKRYQFESKAKADVNEERKSKGLPSGVKLE